MSSETTDKQNLHRADAPVMVSRATIARALRHLIGAVALALPCACGRLSACAEESAAASPRERGTGHEDTSKLRQQADALKEAQYGIASRLTEDFPNNFDAWRVMGFVHSSHGKLAEMFACWEQCRRLAPHRADIYDQLGRYSQQREEYEQAIVYWKEALRISPKMPGVRQRIGYALLNLGRTEEAMVALRQEVDVSPQSSQTHYLLGEAYLQLQEFAKAKDSYQLAVRLQPQHKHAYYGLIKACSRLGQAEEASSYAQAFQRLETAAAAADLVVRRQYDDLGQMRQRLAVTCTDAGRVYSRHNNSRQAEFLWTKAATLDAKNTACRKLLASRYQKQRKVDEALRQYQELARIQPNNLSHFGQIGFLQARLGNLAAAESALERMVNLAPKKGAGYRALAKLYLNTNRELARARELAVTAVKLEPVADSFFVLAWANAKNGNLPVARVAAEKAMRLNPENTTYRKLYESFQKKQ